MDTLPVYAAFNFGPVSARDNILYTCLRPGYNKKDKNLTYQEQLDQMEDWVQFMKGQQQITNVIALLDDNELLLRNDAPQIYLRDLYTNWEIPFLIQPIKGDSAYKNIMEYIDIVASNNGRVIVHCASGAGRAGLVAAGWLVHKYGCTPAEATAEVLEHASKFKVHRKGNVDRLEAWINGTITSYEMKQYM